MTHRVGRRSPCAVQAAGTIALWFYGELEATERDAVATHLTRCRDCRETLEELTLIREALAARPEVLAPPSGDWSRFTARLDEAVSREVRPAGSLPAARPARSRYLAYLAMAALLVLATLSVRFVARSRIAPPQAPGTGAAATDAARPRVNGDPGAEAAFASLSEEHFERSKLVVLGLTTKDAAQASIADWTYERTLASSLLTDTRLYRMAAEDNGMQAVAGVMRDLEMVLLQTALTDVADRGALGRIQRLIEKRDLLEKMSVVTTTGL